MPGGVLLHIDHCRGTVLADGFGRRQDDVVLQRNALLEPLGIPRYATDAWGASTRHRKTEAHQPDTRNTHKIAPTHLTLRTRSKR